MTHTPGEWKQRNEWNGIAIFNEQFGNIALVEGRRAETETISNANLIAAAPELLEALENIITYRDRIDPLYFQLEKLDDYINRAHIVIAKAQGE